MVIQRFRPEFFGRTCADCKRWLYRPDGTKMVRGRPQDGGKPIPRPEGQPTPCHECPKVPDDAPEKSSQYALEPSERSKAAYLHYLECVAVGRFPDDPIVRRNAAIIRRVEQMWERQPLQTLLTLLSRGSDGDAAGPYRRH